MFVSHNYDRYSSVVTASHDRRMSVHPTYVTTGRYFFVGRSAVIPVSSAVSIRRYILVGRYAVNRFVGRNSILLYRYVFVGHYSVTFSSDVSASHSRRTIYYSLLPISSAAIRRHSIFNAATCSCLQPVTHSSAVRPLQTRRPLRRYVLAGRSHTPLQVRRRRDSAI